MNNDKTVKFKKPFERLSPINEARTVQVIEIVSIVGEGIGEGTPIREIREYFSLGGDLLARRDPWLDGELTRGVWSKDL